MAAQTELEFLKNNTGLFLSFLKEKYPLYNNSNVFLRDIQYGIKSFFARKNVILSYRDIDIISAELINVLENKEIFQKLNSQTWKVNYSEESNVTKETEQIN